MSLRFINVQHIECFISKATSYGPDTCIDFEIDNVFVTKISFLYQYIWSNYVAFRGQ